MAHEKRSADERDLKFSYGTRELAQAAPKTTARELSLQGTAANKAVNPAQGFDPYNTSGSFDRKKHWARVGKR
jgi:hypothetical protein